MASKAKGTVLVVDDDASLPRSLRRLLELHDLDVLVFDSAEDFLASGIPDGKIGKICLLLDIYLPGMSGIELCQTLAAASGRSIPVILMSANDDNATRRRAGEAAAVGILFKPFDEDVLLNMIERAFGAK